MVITHHRVACKSWSTWQKMAVISLLAADNTASFVILMAACSSFHRGWMLINELPWLPDIHGHQYTMRCKEIRGAFRHHCWGDLAGHSLPPTPCQGLEARCWGRWSELCSWLPLGDRSDTAARSQLFVLNKATLQLRALKRVPRRG